MSGRLPKARFSHPLNPCQWGNAAKLWELLRRNEGFQRRVARLARLSKFRTFHVDGLLDCAELLLDRMEEYNPFAARAARWFFAPQVHRHRKRRRDVAELDPRVVESMKREYGWHTGLAPAQAKAIEDRVIDLLTYIPNTGGAPSRIGPHLGEEAADELQAWKDAGHNFSITLPWSETPRLFQASFEGLWSSLEPGTSGFLPGDGPYQTNFFQEWSLPDLLDRYARTVKLGNDIISSGERPILESRRTRGGNRFNKEIRLRAAITDTEYVRALEFSRLASEYHVFCYPKRLRLSAGQIDKAFKVWRDQVKSEQKKSKADILGTPTQWDILLNIEDALRVGMSQDEALQWSYLLHCGLVTPVQRNASPSSRRIYLEQPQFRVLFRSEGRWPSWQRDFQSMDSLQNGGGWVQRVFPELLLSSSPTPSTEEP